jgi:predicted transcriptional regulator
VKSVLISIQPKWCELIASGEKTVEVRKTKPKLETPFKVYIYETQGRTETPFVDEEGHHIFKGRGQVIGEFVCDRIVQFENSLFDEVLPETVARSCVPMYDLLVYLGKQDYGYGWHISDLVIYDKPRELSEFKRACDGNCQSCQYAIWQTNGWAYEPYIVDCKPITRPPQSWCYVWERSENGKS